jgi:asparagine synthase (glutamine-hydrolysing)
MCGIIGIASVRPVQKRDWLLAGRDAMTHRGPDDAGLWWSGTGQVGLAQRRLSIIDLSPAGHQPMHDLTGQFTIVFNGEIYNFDDLRKELTGLGVVFVSHSDTEVILSAYKVWGTECLAKLNGMFAFAIYDAVKQTMFLARDRAGEKPLYIFYADDELRFASELKGLLEDRSLPRRINRDSLDCYLSFGSTPGERCILEGFTKLPPAHAQLFDLKTGKHKTWRYWQLPALDEAMTDRTTSDADLLHELEQLLEDSVRRQLVADVPVGILLSGGVDSSLVTALAVRSSSNVQTYSIGFPGYGEYDETKHARLVANHFGTKHTELVPEPTGADLLFRLARQYDEPMVDSSMIPTFLVSQLVRQHCTVALGGDGGDELFGGYGHYSRLLWLQTRLGRVPQSLRRVVSVTAEKFLPVGLRGRNWLQGLGENLNTGLPLISSLFDQTTRRQLMAAYPEWSTQAEGILSQRMPTHPDLIQRATRMDFGNYLAEDILVKVDRASMLNSLEVRAPFLDYRVIEFAYGKVPTRLKTTVTDKKIILKQLCQKLLPPEFDRQRKQGFSIPLAQWLKGGELRELFYDVLGRADGLFDKKTVVSLLKGQDHGRGNSQRLFALVLFELWRREYEVTL